MLINFNKMHGLGNDFVVVDLITQRAKFNTEQIRRITDRHLGIGCDQLILIEPPIRSTTDFYYRIFNANGKEAEQCGNGARCAARFFFDHRFTQQRTIHMDCLAGLTTAIIEDDNSVTIGMGVPKFKPEAIPFIAEKEALVYPIQVNDKTINISVVSMGNPHAIYETQHLDAHLVQTIGSALSQHPAFPKETNVEFMQILDRNHIRLKVFERGVGETLACGSGAAAAVVAGIRNGTLDSPVQVIFPNGQLKITWENSHAQVYLSGPATSVFIGRLNL